MECATTAKDALFRISYADGEPVHLMFALRNTDNAAAVFFSTLGNLYFLKRGRLESPCRYTSCPKCKSASERSAVTADLV